MVELAPFQAFQSFQAVTAELEEPWAGRAAAGAAARDRRVTRVALEPRMTEEEGIVVKECGCFAFKTSDCSRSKAVLFRIDGGKRKTVSASL